MTAGFAAENFSISDSNAESKEKLAELSSLNLLDLSLPEPSAKSESFAIVKALEPEASETKEKGANTKPEQDELRLYPELLFLQQAEQTLASDNANSRQSWEQANAYFHLSELQLETYMDRLGGAQMIRQKMELFAGELRKAVELFARSERGFQSSDYPGKQADELELRAAIKDLKAEQIIGTLLGQQNPELKDKLLNVLDADEKEMLSEIELNSNKLALLPAIKIKHALAANSQFQKSGELSSKILAENILKSIAAYDPAVFQSSPEIRGLLLQSQNGDAMDLSDGKAVAVALTEEAKKLILNSVEGTDALFDGERRQTAAVQAIRLLAAALSANFEQASKYWLSWPASGKYPFIFERAKDLLKPAQ